MSAFLSLFYISLLRKSLSVDIVDCTLENECNADYIVCRADDDCIVNCNGNNACYNAEIHAESAKSLEITCSGGGSTGSCSKINIWCPPAIGATPRCTIIADDSLHDTFDLYAINSWNDIVINYSGTWFLSGLGWGKMHCTSDYSSECFIKDNTEPWTCVGDALCNNLPTPSGSTTITPTTSIPTNVPTSIPTTVAPTVIPTLSPITVSPTAVPTMSPITVAPTTIPTMSPTSLKPTVVPTSMPSLYPTNIPTFSANTATSTTSKANLETTKTVFSSTANTEVLVSFSTIPVNTNQPTNAEHSTSQLLSLTKHSTTEKDGEVSISTTTNHPIPSHTYQDANKTTEGGFVWLYVSIGCLFGIAIIICCVLFIHKKRKQNAVNDTKMNTNMNSNGDGLDNNEQYKSVLSSSPSITPHMIQMVKTTSGAINIDLYDQKDETEEGDDLYTKHETKGNEMVTPNGGGNHNVVNEDDDAIYDRVNSVTAGNDMATPQGNVVHKVLDNDDAYDMYTHGNDVTIGNIDKITKGAVNNGEDIDLDHGL